MAKYQSTKTYGTDRGLSCSFRQWKANHSHCSTLHGYSLGFKFVWESETLDEKNWCFDFGGMKPIKQYLDSMFDHTVLVAEDDPALPFFKKMAEFSTIEKFNGVNENIGFLNPVPHEEGRICALRIVPGVGCEMTAKMVYEETVKLLEQMKSGELGRYSVNPDVRLVSVECFEHGANSAIYYGDDNRRTFYVDVGDMPEDQASAYLENIKDKVEYQEFAKIVSHDSITTNASTPATLLSLLTQSLKSNDPQVLANLEEFNDALMNLHKLPPVAEGQKGREIKVTSSDVQIKDENGTTRVRLGRI